MGFLVQMSLWGAMSLGLVFGGNAIAGRQMVRLERSCHCQCVRVGGEDWLTTHRAVRALLLDGERLHDPFFRSGVIVCVRPDEADAAGRLRVFQSASDVANAELIGGER